MSSYNVYISDVSYFSGKFEAYLRYRNLPYNRIHADAKTFATTIYQHTGMMQVPTVQTPDGHWLRDTTPMIDWFETQHKFTTPLVPSNPAEAFLHKLLEDFADEWLWQPAMYWRWMFKPSAKLLGRRIADEVMQTSPFPVWLGARYYAWRQKHEWLHNDGMTTANQSHIANRYLTVLLALEQILQQQPYLSGHRPGLADFGLFGPFFRHFGVDPYPAEIMRTEAPETYNWISRLWASPSSSGQLTTLDPIAWQPIFTEINQAYLPYLAANAQAWQAQLPRFDLSIQNQLYPQMKTTQYRVWCLAQLQRRYQTLPPDAKEQLKDILAPENVALLSAAIVISGIETQQQLPIQTDTPLPTPLQQLQLMCFGTPRDRPHAKI